MFCFMSIKRLVPCRSKALKKIQPARVEIFYQIRGTRPCFCQRARSYLCSWNKTKAYRLFDQKDKREATGIVWINSIQQEKLSTGVNSKRIIKLIYYKKLRYLVFRTGNHVYIPAPLKNKIDIFEKIMQSIWFSAK